MLRAVRLVLRHFGAVRLLAVAAVLLGSGCWAAQASAYVYWTNSGNGTIGRANLNGTEANQKLHHRRRPPDRGGGE